MSDYISQQDAAALLAVSVKTISRLRRDGQLPWVKVRGSIRIKRSDIQCHLKNPQELTRQKMDFGTSISHTVNAPAEQAYGRRIALQQKLGFSAG